jgi:alpha-L-fucosidase
MRLSSQVIASLSIALAIQCAIPSVARSQSDRQIAPGPFKADWQSFEQNYTCPDWFRDAKFGIWAHWTAQCVPEDGDWYARNMYLQGSDQYKFHLEHYGHPSTFGFMEFDNLWKAENWEPEKLMALYKKAGAKYFVALANHHDNFDAYDSKYHEWNSVRVGPKKDIVGTWAKVARSQGLYFGVSNHSAHAWHWFQAAYAYDAEGEKAGVRYDAARLTKADGKGKWWEGLDPQNLYTGPNMVMPEGLKTVKEQDAWHEANDRQWTEDPPKNNPAFMDRWYLRAKDLIDSYSPDYVYFDDYGLPLGQAGLDIVAHYYNANARANGGRVGVVVTAKELTGAQNQGIVEDFERGYVEGIKTYPWQTCSCIGGWHYSRSRYEKKEYKSVEQVVRQLVDIVSKNGNLLLSIPLRGDGTIDDLELAFLKGMERWMGVNGEAIYGTRPWKIFGEGPTIIKTGMFNEGDVKFTPMDFRFTVKGKDLYVIMMGWPAEKEAVVAALASGSSLLGGKKITGLSMLGSASQVQWTQDASGLHITLPGKPASPEAVVFRVAGIL